MKRIDYLKKVLQLKLFAKRPWVISAFSVTKGSTNETYPGKLIPQPWGFSFITEEGTEEKIEDAIPNQPLFTFKEKVKADSSFAANITAPIETSIGNLLFNAICILSSFGAKHPYILGRVSISSLEKDIALKLQDTPVDESKRTSAYYYVDEYIKFIDSLQYIATFSQLATVSATSKNITSPDGIVEFKNALIKKYGDTLTDPVSLAKFDKELLDFDSEYLKGDPTDGIFTSGKIKHTARKKMFLSVGAPLKFTQSQGVTPITNSLEQGWPTDPKLFAAAMNDSRYGSYSRGAETVKGGVSSKYLLRAANNFKIIDTDCGTNLGIRRTFNKTNIDRLIGRSVMVGSKIEFVKNIEEANNYLNRPLIVRSPMYCKLDGDNICKVCAGYKISQYPTGLTIPLTEISSTILTASLKMMHQNTTATAKLNLAQSLS